MRGALTGWNPLLGPQPAGGGDGNEYALRDILSPVVWLEVEHTWMREVHLVNRAARFRLNRYIADPLQPVQQFLVVIQIEMVIDLRRTESILFFYLGYPHAQ